MRPSLLAVPILAAALALPTLASALNPQPLPPRIHPMSHRSHDEPPDPCLQFHSHHQRDRCEAHRRHDHR
ncbi:MAG TPA: hypothetical protein VKU90_16145 [Caulobacteraceae bacterium]|nr:hypothetical protein [Caulobacteraceae bacterium]